MDKRPDNIALLFFFSGGIVTASAYYDNILVLTAYITAGLFFIILKKTRLFVSIFTAGSVVFILHNHIYLKTRDSVDHLQGREITVFGKISSVNEYDLNSSVIISSDSISAKGKVYPVSAKFSSYLNRTGLGSGDIITVKGVVKPIAGPKNKYETDRRRFSSAEGICCDVADARIVSLRRPESGFNHAVNVLQRKVSGVFDRRLSYKAGNFLTAVMTGRKNKIERGQVKEFADSGTIHLLAVSGLHVGFVVLILGVINMFLGLKRWPLLIFNSAVLIFYAFFTGGSPSVIRAVLMAVILMLGRPLKRKMIAADVIGSAGLISLTYDPNQIFMPGFILSFAAVISIAIIYEPLSARLKTFLKSDNRLIIKNAEGILLSVSVTIGLLPFVLHIFGRYNFVSIISNLVLIPLTGAAFMSGILLLVTDSVNILAVFISDISDLIVRIITYTVSATSKIELFTLFAYFDVLTTSALLSALASVFYFKNYRNKAFFAFMPVLILSFKAAAFSELPSLYIFSMSSGRCAIYKNDGEYILFASKIKEGDINRILKPYLSRSNISEIDYLVTRNEWYETEAMISALDIPVRNVAGDKDQSFGTGSFNYADVKNTGKWIVTATARIGFGEKDYKIESDGISFTIEDRNTGTGEEIVFSGKNVIRNMFH